MRTAGLLTIDECRNHKSFKNDPNEWKQLCIEGMKSEVNEKHHNTNITLFEIFTLQSHLIGQIRRVRVVMKKSSNALRKYSLNHGIWCEKPKIWIDCLLNHWPLLHSARSMTRTRRSSISPMLTTFCDNIEEVY